MKQTFNRKSPLFLSPRFQFPGSAPESIIYGPTPVPVRESHLNARLGRTNLQHLYGVVHPWPRRQRWGMRRL